MPPASRSTAPKQIDDNLVNLSPGMAVTVEIKTGSRTIISYLLSPLLCHRGSLRTQLFLHSANRRCVQGRVVPKISITDMM
jgi:hypothetical protein